MALTLYLAMTAAEFAGNHRKPRHIAWMACHFSPYGSGLSNCPELLPEGAMLILNDRTPIAGHDPDVILAQLQHLTERCKPQAVLLDLQRRDSGESAALAKRLAGGLPCPVGVSEGYAANLDCPVFLPPCPVDTALEDHISPWAGREIWLDAAPGSCTVTLTDAGADFRTEKEFSGEYPHYDEKLCCGYRTELTKDSVRFRMARTPEDLRRLLDRAAALGIPRAIGLYQELGDHFCGY